MKIKQNLNKKLKIISVLTLVLSSGLCAGFFTMPAMAKTASQPVMAMMTTCQETASHHHGFYNGPLLTTDHRAPGPADCCISHARSYQTIVRTSDSQRHLWTVAMAPSTVSLALVDSLEQPRYFPEVFPPPGQTALASVIKLE
jgi:hypothetical protein